MTTEATKRVECLLPPSFQSVFRRVAIAEEEIQAVLSKPDIDEATKKRVNGAFLALRPFGLSTCTEEVYRHHAREILSRVIDDKPLDPGTDAEVMIMLSNTSLRAPLNDVGQGLYEKLFQRIFGKLPFVSGGPEREPWPYAHEEFLHQCRRKLARDRRAL